MVPTTVLMVDDEPDILTIGELSLASVGGLKVLQSSGGAPAVEMAARHRPDVVLLDVMMPGMDGRAIMALFKARPETQGIPVIFMTARAGPADEAELKALGAVGVIVKPFDPMTLAAQVRRIVAPL